MRGGSKGDAEASVTEPLEDGDASDAKTVMKFPVVGKGLGAKDTKADCACKKIFS